MWSPAICFDGEQNIVGLDDSIHITLTFMHWKGIGIKVTHIYTGINKHVNKLYAFIGYNYRVFRTTSSRMCLFTWNAVIVLTLSFVRSKNLNHVLV